MSRGLSQRMVEILDLLQSKEANEGMFLNTVELAIEILGTDAVPPRIYQDGARPTWNSHRERQYRQRQIILNSFWRTMKLLESRGLIVGELRVGKDAIRWAYINQEA